MIHRHLETADRDCLYVLFDKLQDEGWTAEQLISELGYIWGESRRDRMDEDQITFAKAWVGR